jgi:hypothetical protein
MKDISKMQDGIVISRNGMSIFIERENNESNSSLWRRGWFMIKQKQITTQDYEKSLIGSRIWSKHSQLGCKYNPFWMNIINRTSKNYFI